MRVQPSVGDSRRIKRVRGELPEDAEAVEDLAVSLRSRDDATHVGWREPAVLVRSGERLSVDHTIDEWSCCLCGALPEMVTRSFAASKSASTR